MTSRVMHFEIPVDDPDRAGRFYADVFSWTVSRWGPVDYWTLTTGAPSGPGAEGALTPRADAPDGVLVYVGVPDVDSALGRVSAAGGEPLTGGPSRCRPWSQRHVPTDVRPGPLLGDIPRPVPLDRATRRARPPRVRSTRTGHPRGT